MKSPVYYERRAVDDFIGPICEHPYPAHVHDVVEILCMLEGTALELTIGGVQVKMSPGDIAVVFPSTPHSYDVVSEDMRGVAMIFSPETISVCTPAFRSLVPIAPLVKAEDKPPEMNSIIRTLDSLSAQPDKSPLLTGYLHLFLSYLFTCLPLQPAAQQIETSLACQVLRYIADHYTEPLSLESVSHALGISRIHLSHVCSQQLRINFRQHINALRITQACSMLMNPTLSVSQVAYACGYGNLRTFHRAFQAQCSMSPGEFRQERSSSPANP